LSEGEELKMATNDGKSFFSVPDFDWPVMFVNAVGTGGGMGSGMLVSWLADLHFPWGFMVVIGGLVVGTILGQYAGRRIVRNRK
jgi:hypothetical protein